MAEEERAMIWYPKKDDRSEKKRDWDKRGKEMKQRAVK